MWGIMVISYGTRGWEGVEATRGGGSSNFRELKEYRILREKQLFWNSGKGTEKKSII